MFKGKVLLFSLLLVFATSLYAVDVTALSTFRISTSLDSLTTSSRVTLFAIPAAASTTTTGATLMISRSRASIISTRTSKFGCC